MAGPLLEPKLHAPRRRGGAVQRPRLDARLGRAWEARLTLVSAPAGFGKTTLLTGWLAATASPGRRVAWLSLDRRDDDPAVFWPYLVAALRTAAPGVGDAALALLHDPRQPTEAALATLLNDLHEVTGDVALVLDDLHLVETRAVHDGVAYLLEHLPPHVHLVVATRADPPLPLARLRARGDLVEVRAADLRFTAEETTAYLTGPMGLSLTGREVEALDGRTEGWIAALQLAALSMQGRDDVGAFVAGFAGDDRYVVDYLVEEVLQRLPDDVRGFLLRTSVLSRLTGTLCDALTGGDGARAMLETLERRNLFLVPLDDRRRWYRYHHLFADVLRARLLAEEPERVPELHRRAADWFERHGGRAEAIGHALAGGHVERAADLVELAIPATRQARQEATVRRWLDALPEDVIRRRPVLSVGYAGTLMAMGELGGVEARLRDAERWLDGEAGSAQGSGAPSGAMVVVDHEAFRAVPGAIALYRAAQAHLHGDLPATRTHAERALRLAGGDDLVALGSAAGLLALVSWASGDLDAAHRWWADSRDRLASAGHVSDVLGVSIALSDIRLAQGRLRDARSTLEAALRLASEQPGPVPVRGSADMHAALAEVLREQGDLDGAAAHLRTCRRLGEGAGLAQHPYRWRVAAARLEVAQGRLDGAVDLLDEAERRYAGDFFPEVTPVHAVRARVRLVRGELGAGVRWATEHDLSADDDLHHLREYEHLTLARVLLARYAAERDERLLQDATGQLERLAVAAEAGGRTAGLLDALVLQALAHRARGDLAAAMPPLLRALALAEPEGHVGLVVDAGVAVVPLLRAAAQRGADGAQVRRLLGAVRAAGGAGAAEAPGAGDGAGDTAGGPGHRDLVDPLSPRELEVLRLLTTDLDGPSIARHLVLSLNTVRTHTRNVYAKLGVTSRRAAVRRAGELGLLRRT